jgi:hypothetical protein
MDLSRRRFVGAGAALAGFSVASLAVSAARPVVSSRARSPVPVSCAPRHAAQIPLVSEALAALDRHAGRIRLRDRIGVVDFSRPSSEPRLHLVDTASGRIERSFLVAHGSGSDPARTGMLQRFSNAAGSNASSRGTYCTAGLYVGKHGRSRRLVGLDPDNDRALERDIVIHGAAYVDPGLAASQGRIGRSQGCFAVEPGEVETVLALLGEGRMIYAAKRA